MTTRIDDFWAYATLIPLWTAVLWRLPVAIRRPPARMLWWVFVALAIAMTTRITAVGTAIHHATGIAEAGTLVKHLLGIGAVALLLRWVVTIVPGREDGAREPRYRRAISSRPRRIGTWAAVVITTAVFPLANTSSSSTEDADFIFMQAGHFWGSLHLLLFYAYLSFGLLCATMMCADAWRRDSGSVFGRGLRNMAVGCAVGSAYGIIRSAYLLCRLARRPFLGGEEFLLFASNLALVVCLLLVILGSLAPVFERIDGSLRAHAEINDLRPMWRHITAANPQVILRHDPEGRPGPGPGRFHALRRRAAEAGGNAADFWSWRDLDYRLCRRVTEILDAARALQAYLPPGLKERAVETARKADLPPHIVQAYLLHTAMMRQSAGVEPSDEQARCAILTAHEDLHRTVLALLPVGKSMTDISAMSRFDRCLHAATKG